MTIVNDATAVGARLATGSKRSAGGKFFYRSTVLLDVPLEALFMNDEPFGPSR